MTGDEKYDVVLLISISSMNVINDNWIQYRIPQSFYHMLVRFVSLMSLKRVGCPPIPGILYCGINKAYWPEYSPLNLSATYHTIWRSSQWNTNQWCLPKILCPLWCSLQSRSRWWGKSADRNSRGGCLNRCEGLEIFWIKSYIGGCKKGWVEKSWRKRSNLPIICMNLKDSDIGPAHPHTTQPYPKSRNWYPRVLTQTTTPTNASS